MARKRNPFPPLRWLEPAAAWGIYWQGRRKPFHADRGTAERMRLAFLADPDAPPRPDFDCPTLDEVLANYERYATRRYARQPEMLHRFRRVQAAAVAVHGRTPASAFRGRALRDVRERLAAETPPLSRRYINHLIGSLKTAFAWLVTEEIVQPDVLAAVRAVRALGADEGGEELPRPAPADPAAVAATLPELSPVVAAMVRLQQSTGMRPGEVCRMRRQDVSTSADNQILVPGTDGRKVAAIAVGGQIVWMYVPARHKNTWRGKPKIVPIGPAAQAVLAPWLMKRGPGDNEFLFQPADALHTRRGRNMIRPGVCYTVQGYSRAVARAILRAGCERWTVYGIRRAAAERVADMIDAESAAVMLGHSASKRSIDSYVSLTVEKSAIVAAKCG